MSADGVAWNETLTRAAVKGGRSFGRCEWNREHEATDMHHRRNASQGGGWCPANIIHLCRTCHHEVTVNPAWAESVGLTLKAGQDAEATPIRRSAGDLFLTNELIAIAGVNA